jgi:hypothetical protein
MTGWEAASQAGALECPYHDPPGGPWQNEVYYQNYIDELADSAVNDLGLNRLRVHSASKENPVDHFWNYYTGVTDRLYWRDRWHEIINDDDDPFSVDSAYASDPGQVDFPGYQSSVLDYNLEKDVLPFVQAANSAGKTFYLNYAFGHPKPDSPDPVDLLDFRDASNKEEYAENRLAGYIHAMNKYGLHADSIEIVNEPRSNRGWTAQAVGENMVATAQRMESHGFTPDFVTPSTVSPDQAISWFDQMVSIPNFLGYLDEIAFHRYGTVTDSHLLRMGFRGLKYGKRTAQLEKYDGGGTVDALHKDLKIALVSAWQQFALAYCGEVTNGSSYYSVLYDEDLNGDGWPDDPAKTTVVLRDRSKHLRQYFKFIPIGAQRISAQTPNCLEPDFTQDPNDPNEPINAFSYTYSCTGPDPVAFFNPDGTYIVVVKTSQSETFSIQGLPAGTYGIKYTTGNPKVAPIEYDVDLPDQTISQGQTLTTSIPKVGVITVYGKISITTTISPTSTPTSTPTPIPIPGDANGDDIVDGADYVIWLVNYLTDTSSGSSVGDFNKSGTVDGVDYVIWLNNYFP